MKIKQALFLILLSVLLNTTYAQNPIVLKSGFTCEKFLKKDQKDVYELKLNPGQYVDMELIQKGVDVVIDQYDPSGKKIQSFDTPNGANGPELIRFEAKASGLYRLEVAPFIDPGISDSIKEKQAEDNQGSYSITHVQILSASQYKQMLAEEKVNSAKIIGWISSNSIPLKSVTAGSGFDDLQPLKEILKDVHYVGLGEATHGTREFFQMKHRMLEFLVKEMGFTVFAIEASYAGCRNINNYVLDGKGDAHTALASQGFWTWDTEEVIDMIEWIRQYNQTVSAEKKVKFAGFDIQVNTLGGGVKKIEDYLQKTDTIGFKKMKPLLDSVEHKLSYPEGDSARTEYINFLSWFVMSKGILVQRSSLPEYEAVLEYVRTLGQLMDAYIISKTDPRMQEREWRDYYMASNFMNLVEEEKPGTKFVIWAHNGHISHNYDTYANGGMHPFGSYLKAAYGNNYYAFGFSFNKGSFQAMNFKTDGTMGGLSEFTIDKAKEKSLDWYFAQTNTPMFIINFRSKALPGFMNEFVNKGWDSRSFGAAATQEYVEQSYGFIIPAVDFDGMIFIDTTTRSRPTATGDRPAKN